MKRLSYIALASLLYINPAYSQSINTTSNSTGSVTNQAVQVVPSRQFQSSVGSGITCQGATLNISPFLSTTNSYSSPYEPTYMENIYDTTTNDAGALINPGTILYQKPVRTGQKSNTSINGGITATFSIPLDGDQIALCKQAMAKQVELYNHSIEAKKLNYHMSRINTCAKQLREGIRIKKGTPLHGLCADLELTEQIKLPDHKHSITSPVSTSSPPGSVPASSSSSQTTTTSEDFYQPISKP